MRHEAGANPRLFTFVGGNVGKWSVVAAKAAIGDPLAATERLEVVHGPLPILPETAEWALRGVTSNLRYVTRTERELLQINQAELDRPEATLAALIPIRKSTAWWDMSQDERRKALMPSPITSPIVTASKPNVSPGVRHV